MNKSKYEEQNAEKRANLEKLRQFRDLMDEMGTKLNSMADQMDQMKSGTESVADMLATWKSVAQCISLGSLGLLKYTENSSDLYPEPLLRLRLEGDEKEVEQEEVEEEND
ncbi:uncharacterized protein J8A68_000557 [[Candida] subhashii]|uniref:DASH complex subunit DAD2 n=1 Tax=[Candida] subhashii TaxID=561895 RepID=A0A8J5QS92_9ASCO|nr:uncharacterized protein J8A68_000557 [[Candida] subhashii]KAG7665934.1 hypothetical protein J8A68_000557 [[Candida] subhashii]